MSKSKNGEKKINDPQELIKSLAIAKKVFIRNQHNYFKTTKKSVKKVLDVDSTVKAKLVYYPSSDYSFLYIKSIK